MSQITLGTVDASFYKYTSLKTTQFLLGTLSIFFSAHTRFQAAISQLYSLTQKIPWLLLPISCQSFLLNSGFLSFHGLPPTRVFPLRRDILEALVTLLPVGYPSDCSPLLPWQFTWGLGLATPARSLLIYLCPS